MINVKELYFNCCLGQMFVSDVSQFLVIRRQRSEPYSQTRIKVFAAYFQPSMAFKATKFLRMQYIKILMSSKSISDKNCYDQLFIT